MTNSWIGQGSQSADKSWWPKQSTWNHSGLNLGYWSRDCENWFQKRLVAIHSNTAFLRTAGEWKTSLKFHHKSGQLASANECAAAMYLDGHLF